MLNIRNPKFGNVFTAKTGVLIHELMDSDVQVFVPSDRPVFEGFSVSFDSLNLAEMLSLVDFFTESAGELITIQDHEGTNWTGMIMDDRIVFTEGRRNCQWATSFRFEGTPSETYDPVGPPVLPLPSDSLA